MKKLIGTVVLAALVAGAAFAEVNVGAGFNRAVFNIIGYDGDAKTYLQTSWGGAPRIAASISGASDQAGYAVDLNFDVSWGGLGDNCAIWVKPFDWLMLKAGKFYDDTLRGSCCFGADGWGQPSNFHGDDLTFLRGMNGNKGVLIALTPIEGLYIGLGIPTPIGTSTPWNTNNSVPDPYGNAGEKIADTFKKGQYQVGYTIADTATIKARYIGQGDWGIINAAVDLLMLEGQKISVGAFIPTDADKNSSDVGKLYGKANKKLGIGVTYNGSFDALSLAGYVLFDMFNMPAPVDSSLNVICVGVGLGYDLGDGLGLEGDVRADIYLPGEGDSATEVSAGIFLNKGLSNGSIGIGAQIAVPVGDANVSFVGLKASDEVHFAVPVRMQVSF